MLGLLFPAVCLLPGSQGTVIHQLFGGYVIVEFGDAFVAETDEYGDGSIALVDIHVSKLRRCVE